MLQEWDSLVSKIVVKEFLNYAILFAIYSSIDRAKGTFPHFIDQDIPMWELVIQNVLLIVKMVELSNDDFVLHDLSFNWLNHILVSDSTLLLCSDISKQNLV